MLPHRPLSLWSLQSAATANEFGQYRLEVLLALTEEEGDQFLGELAGADRAESPEVFWDGSTDIGPEYDDNTEVYNFVAVVNPAVEQVDPISHVSCFH